MDSVKLVLSKRINLLLNLDHILNDRLGHVLLMWFEPAISIMRRSYAIQTFHAVAFPLRLSLSDIVTHKMLTPNLGMCIKGATFRSLSHSDAIG